MIGIPVVLLNSSNHLFVPRTGTVPLTAPETIHLNLIKNYNSNIMLLSENLFVNIDWSLRISLPFVRNFRITHFPLNWRICMNLLFNFRIVQKWMNSNCIKTWNITLLLNTLIVNILDIWSCIQETRFDWMKNIKAFRCFLMKTFFFVCVVNFFRNKIMIFQVFNGKFAEIFT